MDSRMKNGDEVKIPKYYEFMNPLLKALNELGGSANIDELNSKIIEITDLPEKVIDIPLPYRLIDGEGLAEKLKELLLGIKTEMVEKKFISIMNGSKIYRSPKSLA